jgi:hypothetical protein
VDVGLGAFEVFDDPVVFFDEAVDLDPGLVEVVDGLGLFGDEFVFHGVYILEELLPLEFQLFDIEPHLFQVFGVPGLQGDLEVPEPAVLEGELGELGLELCVEFL